MWCFSITFKVSPCVFLCGIGISAHVQIVGVMENIPVSLNTYALVCTEILMPYRGLSYTKGLFVYNGHNEYLRSFIGLFQTNWSEVCFSLIRFHTRQFCFALPGAAHSRTLLIDLKSIYMKKAGQLMLLIPHIKALALPNPVKQATKEPTPILYALCITNIFLE